MSLNSLELLNSKMANLPALKEEKRPALMTHVVLGYPSLQESLDIVKVMDEMGVCCAELQLPFSDPMADGPTIMWANEKALENDTKVADCFKAIGQLQNEVSIPILVMTYFNLVINHSGATEGFCKKASESGVSGLIVPDIPFDDPKENFATLAENYQLAPIPLVSPVTNEKRMKLLSKATSAPFVYCVSTTGTTGARASLPTGLKTYLTKVRSKFKRPLALGFGLSSTEHIDALRGLAEIAIVGSATIDVIRSSNRNNRLSNVRNFLKELI